MRTLVQKPGLLPRPAVSSQVRTNWGSITPHATESPDVGARFGHDFGLVRVNADASRLGVVQRAPADPTPAVPAAEVAQVRRVLEEAKDVAVDLVEETTGRPVNTGRTPSGRSGFPSCWTRDGSPRRKTICSPRKASGVSRGPSARRWTRSSKPCGWRRNGSAS